MPIAVYTFMLLTAVGASLLAGAWASRQANAAAVTHDVVAPALYMCPMHREYTADHTGNCAVCGMRLVARSELAAPAKAEARLAAVPPGTVYVGGDMQRLAGIQVANVDRLAMEHSVRLVARVAPDEARTYSVTAGTGGFVREVSSATTGSRVRKGERLATISAPDAFPAIQSYVVALGAIDRLRQGGGEGVAQAQISSASGNFQLRKEKLQDLGISDAQIAELRRTREIPESITVVAPAGGIVLARRISEGQRFERGTEWYRIADLSRVWIMAEVIGAEAQYVRPGSPVRVTVPGQPVWLDARVSTALPLFDERSRTLRVRLEAENPDDVLRPDMTVEVEVRITRPATTVVSVDAVLDSGQRQMVFVERGEGVFAPRDVKTGWRAGDRVEIVEGLAPGERIVTSGTFLIDSESRMTRAVERAAGTSRH